MNSANQDHHHSNSNINNNNQQTQNLHHHSTSSHGNKLQHNSSLPNGLNSYTNQEIQNQRSKTEEKEHYETEKQENMSTPLKNQKNQGKEKSTKNKLRRGHKQNLTNMTDMGKNIDLKTENKKLRVFNESLKKQLEVFQRRLDDNLRKRVISEKKPRVNQEAVQNMELKNAYKQIDIYKRDLSVLKKKEEKYTQSRVDDLQNELQAMQKQRQQLLREIKLLKKANRLQEKKINQLTGTQLSKIYNENENLKEQNKKLSQRYAKQQRSQKLAKLSASNEKRKAKDDEQKRQDQKKKEEEKEKSQLEILKKKSAKDNIKIANLMAENGKMKQNMENLRQQLVDKDKQCGSLRERLSKLRKQYRTKTATHIETEPSRPVRSQEQKKQEQVEDLTMNDQSLVVLQQSNGIKNAGPGGKYPRLAEAGTKLDQSYKWNHHQFSSKIKEVEVSLNPDNSIKELNFTYQKGSPQRLSNSQYSVFSCENSEFIKSIEGGFMGQKLIYLSVRTSSGRTYSFANHILAQKCENFVFGDNPNEYPGAFFGENGQMGVNRIGCMIEFLK